MPRKLTLVGVLAIAAAALVTYFPILGIGFYLDDWAYLDALNQLGPARFVASFINPTIHAYYTGNLRPLFALSFASQQWLFGTNAVGYHAVLVLLHLANSLLLCVNTWQVSLNRRVGIMAGLYYATLPVISGSVFLPTAADVQAVFFVLLAFWFWWIYLRTRSKWHYAGTLVVFVLGLSTKESVVTLPAILFLEDWLLVREKLTPMSLFRRYLGFVIVLLLYMPLLLNMQPGNLFATTYGMSIGIHVLTNAIQYLAKLTFPWNLDVPFFWTLIAVAIYVFVLVAKRSALLLFLGIAAILGIIPVLGFQRTLFSPRFLYQSGTVSAVLLAMLIENGWRTLGQRTGRLALVALATVILLLTGMNGVAQAAQEQLDDARAHRTPFRDISQQHPTFPNDTFLYFIDSPISLRELSGMFLVRYGQAVTVAGTGKVAQLRDHRNVFVYFFDDTRKPIEVAVQKDAVTNAAPALPAVFDGTIELEGYEISANSLKQGENLVVLLYWRALQKIDKDYTVFAHLVDRDGNTVAAVDSQPAGSKVPTTSWWVNAPVVDWVILPITQDVPAGENYRLDIGLYYLPTMQRLSVVDARNMPLTDQISIESFEIQ